MPHQGSLQFLEERQYHSLDQILLKVEFQHNQMGITKIRHLLTDTLQRTNLQPSPMQNISLLFRQLIQLLIEYLEQLEQASKIMEEEM